MRLRAALFAALISSSAADWTYVKSPNFELYTTAGKSEARKTIENFELVRDFFRRLKSSETMTRLPVTIVAFRTPSEYKPYSPRAASSAFASTDDLHRHYIVLSDTGRDSLPIAVHEYVHLLTRDSGMYLPVWLNEGLAEVYSTLQSTGGSAVVGSIPEGRMQTLRSHQWLPLSRLLEINEQSSEYNEKERAGIFYAQSWLLVHMLMLDNATRDGFPRFLQSVASGVPSAKAFEAAWQLSPAEIEKRLTAYANRETLNQEKFAIRLERLTGLEPYPADPVDVEVVLAMLVAQLDGNKEALSRLYVISRKNPGNWRVHDALGLLSWRASNIGAAREHYRRATELNSPNWTTWWDYALLMRGIDTDETAIRALRRCLELNPAHTEARLTLAEEYNAVKRYKDALTTLDGIAGLHPDLAPRVLLERAWAHAQIGNEPQAREAAEQAKLLAAKGDYSYISRANNILRLLDTRSRTAVSRSPALQPGPPSAKPADVPDRPQHLRLTGTFRELECLGAQARMVISTPSGTVRLLIRDPSRITIKGRNEAMTLSCGPQPQGREVEVEYTRGGDVRTVGFQ